MDGSEFPYAITPIDRLALQRNALRVEVIEPQRRCVLRPKTDRMTLLRRHYNWNTLLLEGFWPSFDYCVSGNGCEHCWVRKRSAVGATSPLTSWGNLQYVVRRNQSDGWWHLLGNAESGWNGFSHWYPTLVSLLDAWSIDLGDKHEDQHGEYWTVILTNPD